MCVEGGSVRVRATCELNLLETHCSVGLVSWLPAQHTKHLNAQCPIDLACAPLAASVCPSPSVPLPLTLCMSLSLHMTRTHLNLFAVNRKRQQASQPVPQTANNLSHLRQQASQAATTTGKEIPILICVESK